MNIFSYHIDTALFWTIILGLAAILVALFAWILPRRAKLHKSTEAVIDHLKLKVETIEKEAKEANENIKVLEKHFGIPIYADGLTSASPPVFDPFANGVKLMTEYKWDEAITELKQSMKEAKASQLVALYNLRGLCDLNAGRIDLAIENYNNSLTLAKELKDKQGEADACGALGSLHAGFRRDFDKGLKYLEHALLITSEIEDKQIKAAVLIELGSVLKLVGDLDRAQKYLEDALSIARENSYKDTEATALNALSFVFKTKGDLNNALKYRKEALDIVRKIGSKDGVMDALNSLSSMLMTKGELDHALKCSEEALKISREIGNRPGEAVSLFSIATIYQDKEEKEKALKYLKDALAIFTEMGAERYIEIIKENIQLLQSE